jgi:uroporphyrinogen decarboxylase
MMGTRITAERAGRLFSHLDMRPVPYWLFGLSGERGGTAEQLDRLLGGPGWRSDAGEAVEGNHVGFIRESSGDGTAVDTFGVVLAEGNIVHVLRRPLEKPSLAGFSWPDPDTMVDWETWSTRYKNVKAPVRMCGLAMGLFERSWFLRGFEDLMVDMVERLGFVDDLLDGIMAIHLRVMDLIAARIPIDAYFGGDDVSDQRGVMMGVDRWRRLFKPRLAKLIAHSHELGLPYVLHACGNVEPLIDDFMEIGLDGLESLQSEANDVYAIKRRSRDRLVLIGGMGVQSILHHGTPDQVRTEAKRLIDRLGDGGGYVIAPSKPLDGVPARNAAAFIETVTCQ